MLANMLRRFNRITTLSDHAHAIGEKQQDGLCCPQSGLTRCRRSKRINERPDHLAQGIFNLIVGEWAVSHRGGKMRLDSAVVNHNGERYAQGQRSVNGILWNRYRRL